MLHLWRKKFVVLSLLILAFVSITACAGTKSSTNKELVVSSFGGKYDEVFTKYVVKPFEAKNPGVKVKLAPYTGVAKMSQGGSSSLDVVQLDDFDIIEAANKGLLQSLKKDEFSTWGQLYPQAFLNDKSGKTYGLTNVFGAWGIAYNPQKVKKPTSWNDLWNPTIKGKVAMMSQWIPDLLMTQKATHASNENMQPVWDAFKKLSVAQYYQSFSAPEALFKTNGIVMASWFDGRTYTLKQSGTPIDFVIPKEGGILIRSGMGVVKKSKNQALAKKLIDFAMNPDAQKGFAKELYYGPTNSSVKLEGNIQQQVVYGKDKVNQLITPDWNTIFPKREEWLQKWQEATAK
ncbi:putative spermidine/putrescine transport system substrate-binding protein [Seinonella peptonophila]|uniref:Putative spermidine/putrescine transport system substrate-binding protein n=1 Tax=Seinonella peptonophila TaxID=112248 RepID=A0A1M4SP52_9BACL|nr:extracellular solute-binding protein [Seinonella peptonophila]SHE34023.1 putative spermidine/putrescine transport system substrate-binding protein [Seinonella peptonophila]